ncbi:MAG: trypsin-like serine protease [Deltaproteobacteria bacterium]|nr:trypsin-like serine protease [Deltaproteobacteria bacterium]
MTTRSTCIAFSRDYQKVVSMAIHEQVWLSQIVGPSGNYEPFKKGKRNSVAAAKLSREKLNGYSLYAKTAAAVFLFIFAVFTGSCESSRYEHSIDNEVSSHKRQILGGHPDSTHKQVGALRRSISGDFFCSGTLIDKEWVLTAAHCVNGLSPSDLFFFLGNGDDEDARQLKIKDIVVYPDYNDALYLFDVALLKLSVPFNDVQPVTINSPGEYPIESNKIALFTGFGLTEKNDYGERLSVNAEIIHVGDSVFSIQYDESRQQGVCFGDSGGAAYYDFGDGEVLIGVISNFMASSTSSDEKCNGSYSVVRTDFFFNWIQSVTGENSSDCTQTDDTCLCRDACGEDGICYNHRCAVGTCEQCYDCLNNCDYNDGACINDCYIQTRSLDVETLRQYDDCYNNLCAQVASNARVECLMEKCKESFFTCFDLDGCNLEDAQCKQDEICQQGRFSIGRCDPHPIDTDSLADTDETSCSTGGSEINGCADSVKTISSASPATSSEQGCHFVSSRKQNYSLLNVLFL